MATKADITLVENNDQIIAVTISPDDPGDDLTDVTGLELYLKTNPTFADDDPTTLVLTSADSSEISIDTQTATSITARAFVPASALVDPYDRFWHLDAIGAASSRRTALYGAVDVINL